MKYLGEILKNLSEKELEMLNSECENGCFMRYHDSNFASLELLTDSLLENCIDEVNYDITEDIRYNCLDMEAFVDTIKWLSRMAESQYGVSVSDDIINDACDIVVFICKHDIFYTLEVFIYEKNIYKIGICLQALCVAFELNRNKKLAGELLKEIESVALYLGDDYLSLKLLRNIIKDTEKIINILKKYK